MGDKLCFLTNQPSLSHLPMSSAKPPTGRRQVPITNCSKRTLFSLSNSRSNCQREHVSNSVNLTTFFRYTQMKCSYQKCHYSSHLPEPLYLLAVAGVVSVDCVSLPLVDIQFLHATEHQLQLLLIKELNPTARDHFVEPT